MSAVLGTVGLAALLAFGAAIQPGPLQAFLLSRVVATGRRRTLPACLAPLISDGPIALLAVVLVGRVPDAAQHALRAAGGVLLLYLAWDAYRQWRNAPDPACSGAPRTLLQAVLVNLLNPNPYLAWTLVLGPAVVAAWNRHPFHALAFVLSFYGTMLATLAAFVLLAGSSGALGDAKRRVLLGLSALLLAALGAALLVRAGGEALAAAGPLVRF